MEDEKKPDTFTGKESHTDEPEERRNPETSPSGGAQGRPPHRDNESPGIDFSTLIMSFASAAMISMGRMPDPASGQISKNLPLAQQNIGIIALLKDKTKGNLTKEEESLLDTILYELRVNYVESLKG